MVSAANQRPTGPDPTHYPVEDEMGEGILQKLIIELLRPLVEHWLDERGAPSFVGANQFIYWVQYEPTRSVAPDLYVLPGIAKDAPVTAWKVWENGVAPSFALEIVSKDVDKDYAEAPRRHDELGVRELVVFDPESFASPERVRWQVHRRGAGQRLVLVERTDADRVRSDVLGCWLRVVGEGPSTRIRLATGARGDDIVPTESEAAREAARAAKRAAREAKQAERKAKQAEREAKQAEREAKQAEEAERARREAAEAEIARLRAELERVRRGG